MKPLRLAVAMLTQKIYVGRVTKDGLCFTDGKQDITNDFLKAVIDRFGDGATHSIRVSDGTDYTVTVTKVAK